MLEFINKLNDKDAKTDIALNPRTSMHVTKKTNQYYNKMQKELAKKGIDATIGQMAHAAIKVVSINKDDITIAKMEQRHNDEQAKLRKENANLQKQYNDAVNQIGTLKYKLLQVSKK